MTDSVLEMPKISAQRASEILNQPFMSTIRWATFEFGIRGLSPILLDRMTKTQVLGLITGQKVDYPKEEPLETKALRKMYSDAYNEDMPEGLYGFPKENLEAALRDAGVGVQYGSGKNDRITMATGGTELHYFLRFREPFYPLLGLDGKPAGWEVDLRKGNATQGKGAVGIVRPRFDEWGVVGHFDLNIDMLSPEKAKEAFTKAGVQKGLCSARPSKKMSFGQFALTHFEWIGGADPKKATTRVPVTKGKKTSVRNRLIGNTDETPDELPGNGQD